MGISSTKQMVFTAALLIFAFYLHFLQRKAGVESEPAYICFKEKVFSIYNNTLFIFLKSYRLQASSFPKNEFHHWFFSRILTARLPGNFQEYLFFETVVFSNTFSSCWFNLQSNRHTNEIEIIIRQGAIFKNIRSIINHYNK